MEMHLDNFDSEIYFYSDGTQVKSHLSSIPETDGSVLSVLVIFTNKHAQTKVCNYMGEKVAHVMQKMEDDREINVGLNKQYDCKKRRMLRHNKSSKKDYGVEAQKPDMDPEPYKVQQAYILKLLGELEK